MHLLILILFLAVGACEAVYWQRLTCPYELKHESLLRVWCRQKSTDCCTGFTFNQNTQLVDGGKLKVAQDTDSFTVVVLEPSHGEGTYWCGVLSKNNTIIKLAEGYFHSSSGAYIWNVTRWILLPLLPMVTIFTNVHSRKITKHMRTKAEEPHMSSADPQYLNAASFCEVD